VDGHVLVACLENVIVAFDAETGDPAGSFKTPAEIRAAPILAGDLLVLGMRDRRDRLRPRRGASSKPPRYRLKRRHPAARLPYPMDASVLPLARASAAD
jgi:hypothetical protein